MKRRGGDLEVTLLIDKNIKRKSKITLQLYSRVSRLDKLSSLKNLA